MTGGPKAKMSSERDSKGEIRPLAQRERDECYNALCDFTFGSIAYHSGRNETYIVGRRAGDGQIVLWGLKNPGMPDQQWRRLEDFKFNVYDRPNTIRLHTGYGGPIEVPPGNLAGSAAFMLQYLPSHDALLLILRTGGSRGGQNCQLDGKVDDCFRMYAFRFDDNVDVR